MTSLILQTFDMTKHFHNGDNFFIQVSRFTHLDCQVFCDFTKVGFRLWASIGIHTFYLKTFVPFIIIHIQNYNTDRIISSILYSQVHFEIKFYQSEWVNFAATYKLWWYSWLKIFSIWKNNSWKSFFIFVAFNFNHRSFQIGSIWIGELKKNQSQTQVATRRFSWFFQT